MTNLMLYYQTLMDTRELLQYFRKSVDTTDFSSFSRRMQEYSARYGMPITEAYQNMRVLDDAANLLDKQHRWSLEAALKSSQARNSGNVEDILKGYPRYGRAPN